MGNFTRQFYNARIKMAKELGRPVNKDESEVCFAETVIKYHLEFEENPEVHCHALSFNRRANLRRILDSREWSKRAEDELKCLWYTALQ